MRLGAWAVGLIHYAGSPRRCEPARGGRDRRRVPAQVRGGGRLRQPRAGGGRQGGGERRPDHGPAQRRGGSLLLRRGGEADRGQGGRRRSTSPAPPTSTRPRPTAPTSTSSTAAAGGSGAGPARASTGDCWRERHSEVPAILAGGLRPENVGEAIAIAHPYAVDVASGVEAEPGRKDHAAMAAFFEAASRRPRGMSAVEGRFGPYGGRYVPETLIPALDELAAAWAEARGGRGVPAPARPPAPRLHRPSDAALPRRAPLRAGREHRLPEARGPRPHRRPQDQQRDRPGAARRADGQAAGDRRDRRRPARGGDGDRLRPARPGMRRLHGDGGHPPPGAQRRPDAAAGGRGGAGRGRRPHPEGGGQRRDPRLGRQRRDDPLRDRLSRRAPRPSRRWSATCSG